MLIIPKKAATKQQMGQIPTMPIPIQFVRAHETEGHISIMTTAAVVQPSESELMICQAGSEDLPLFAAMEVGTISE